MDPITDWENLVSSKHEADTITGMPPTGEEDISYYFQEYKNFDNLFHEALSTLQDLDVPSGFVQENLNRTPRGPSKNQHGQAISHYKHAKKPSGTAIFGFLDHNRELSLSGNSNEETPKMSRAPSETVKSISPAQIARASHQGISNDQLEYNFDQPVEQCPPILLKEEDEMQMNTKKEADIIVTNKNPRSYKFPPDSPKQDEPTFINNSPLKSIQHSASQRGYPDEIDCDMPGGRSKMKRYVPIPVQEPMVGHAYPSSSPHLNLQNSGSSNIANKQAHSPALVAHSPEANHNLKHDTPMFQTNSLLGKPEALGMNMNVFLPPPSTCSSSQPSPEPHSPSPQYYSSPIRNRGESEAIYHNDRNLFYNPQFFSDDVDYYCNESLGFSSSSPIRDDRFDPRSSPYASDKRGADPTDTTTDANETIVQLTPLKNQVPMTPSSNKITLEWSPIISPNGRAIRDVRKAIQDLSPRKMVKKTSLLPPGELDRYWEGPDDEKFFTCTYKNCGKKFTRRYNVRSHIQTHLSDRPFTCSYCPKSFVRQHDLNRHVKSHILAKHCRCKCGKEFTRIEGYRKHLANSVCSKPHEENGAVSKPYNYRKKGDPILDNFTSNRLNEDLGISMN